MNRRSVSLFLLLIVSCALYAKANDAGDRYASASVLSDGRWVKFQVKTTGIYKISYNDLKQLGFAEPAKVSVYGYGGRILDEDFSKTDAYTDDLPPLSVYRGNDYLLFYANGVVRWAYDKGVNGFVHTNNPYSTYGYYFLTDKYGAKPEEPAIPSEEGAGQRITTFDDYRVYEEDKRSLNSSGRELYGDPFYSALEFKVSDAEGITDADGRVDVRFVASCKARQELTLSIDNNRLFTETMPANTGSSYVKALAVNPSAIWSGAKANGFPVKLQFSQTGNNTACLDYIRLQFKRELKTYDRPFTFFRSVESLGYDASRFVIQGANEGTLVFDITDRLNMKRIDARLNGSELSFVSRKPDTLREFVIVQPEKITPLEFKDTKDVAPQNLHSWEPRDMVIIAPPAFKSEAERLAAEHEVRDGLTSYVVTPEEIYNEFSSGTPDATAYRRFLKMFFDKYGQTDKHTLKYLLLFGDGAWDNRFVTTAWKGQKNKDNFLLTYQTQESLNESSYVSDDYFGVLGDEALYASGYYRNIHLGIGRFPVRTLAEARQVVDKVISYMDNPMGEWKNNVCLVADDGNDEDTFTIKHQNNAETLARIIERARPEYIVKKLYFDAFRKGNNGYPEVRDGIQKSLKNGLFLINYVGHGNTSSWSDENVLYTSDIQGASYSFLPVWITASCDFCQFDDVATSAGEYVMLKSGGGGISLFTTSRVAYRESNAEINESIIRSLFGNDPDIRLGDIIRKVKTDYRIIHQLGFCLIGDPALRLNYPQNTIKLTRMNNHELTPDSLFKAMAEITLEGEVLDPSGNIDTQFNGEISLSLFDNKKDYTTLGNNTVQVRKVINGDAIWVDSIRKTNYDDYKNKLYAGKQMVSGGKFSFTFTMPKDISYIAENNAKISLYARDTAIRKDAQGSFLQFRVGMTSDRPVVDNDPPEIRQLFLNDTTFTDGAVVNATPCFYAKVWDRSGINHAGSSVGHDVTLRIDGTTYILNDYYETLPGTDGEGTACFSIPQLTNGLHTGEFIVWDVLNNSARQEFTFLVDETVRPALYKIMATPNPARQSVDFRLSHNRPETMIKVNVRVFDLAGRLLWSHDETGSSEWFKSYIVTWNLTNQSGTRLRPNVYVYRATISTKTSKEATEAQKLIVLAP